jgi:hypothetical protein
MGFVLRAHQKGSHGVKELREPGLGPRGGHGIEEQRPKVCPRRKSKEI